MTRTFCTLLLLLMLTLFGCSSTPIDGEPGAPCLPAAGDTTPLFCVCGFPCVDGICVEDPNISCDAALAQSEPAVSVSDADSGAANADDDAAEAEDMDADSSAILADSEADIAAELEEVNAEAQDAEVSDGPEVSDDVASEVEGDVPVAQNDAADVASETADAMTADAEAP